MFILSLYGLLADYVHIYQHEHKSLMHKTRPGISSLPIYDMEFFGKEQSWLLPRYTLLLPTKGLYVLLSGGRRD